MPRNTDMIKLVFLLVLPSIWKAHSKSIAGDKESCKGVEIVTRKEWMARPPWRKGDMKMPVNDVIIQHTVSPVCKTKGQCIRNIQFIQNYHMDCKGFPDIGYNFLIGGDGRVYEGLGWTTTGSHSINYNTISLGIAFIGDYRKIEPNKAMIRAALNFLDCGAEKGFLTPTREIHGARDVSCSESPGDALYAIIKQWENFKGGRMNQYNCGGDTRIIPSAC